MLQYLPRVWWVILLTTFYSSFSYALSAAECYSLRSDNDFAISFDINNASKNEVVGVRKGVGQLEILPLNLWSDKAFTLFDRVIYDPSIQIRRDYTIWLEYRADDGAQSNKTGTLYYYKVVNGEWSLIDSSDADLKGVNSVHLDVYGLNVDDLACDTQSVSPPILDNSRPEICDLFPEPAQSWVTNGTTNYSYYGASVMNVTNSTVQVNGWSDAYKQENTTQLHHSWDPNIKWNALRVGFDYTNTDWNMYSNSNLSVCDGMGCFPGNDDGNLAARKIDAPPLVDANFSTNQDLVITDGSLFDLRSYRHTCDLSPTSSSKCSYMDLGNNHIAITILQDIEYLDVSTYAGKKLTIHFADGISIEHFTYQGNTEVYFDKNTTVNFKTIVTASNASMTFESNAWINIAGSSLYAVDLLLNNPMLFNYVGESDSGFIYPVIYGPTATYQLKGQIFKGYLLAKQIILDTSITIQGAVTAHYLSMSNNANIQALNGSNQCSVSEEKSYALTISPSEDYTLTCKAQDISLQVVDEDGNPATDYTGYIEVSPSSNLTVVTGSGSSGVYQPNSSGLLELSLSSTKSEDKTVTTSLSSDTDTSNVSGTYHFVPYTFDVDDQYVIANKPQSVPITVQACDDSGGVIDIGYTGTPSYSSEWVAPTSGIGQLTMSNLAFSSGAATATLTMEDSGVKTVTLTDSKFNCSSYGSDCPIKGNGTLQGSFTVYSRPWTFAVCPSDGDAMDGNITDANSEGFKAAGESFALHIKPIRWVSNGSVSGAIETTNYCSSPVTQNFFSTDTQLAATVNLDHDVAEPSGGASGVLKDSDGDTSVTLLNTDGTSNSYYDFSGLTWSEVGVLQIQANTQSSYLGQTIQTGYRNIGRFYPAYLTITSNSWTYASNLDGFAYMNQPISYSFNVEAQNMSGGATTNYGDFGASLIANIKLVAVNTNAGNENIGARVADYDEHYWGDTTSWSGAALSVTRSFTLLKNETVSSPYTTSPDGPFTSGFGLEVTDSIDNVDFTDKSLARYTNQILDSTNKAFPTQPDFRYGRMVLSDVGGNSESTLSVPLKTQYWNGSQFVVNTEDSGSVFSTAGDGLCKQTIWQNTVQSSSSTLSGASAAVAVTNGQSSVVKVLPDSDTDLREKVRFWIRLDDSSTVSPQTTSSADIDCGSTYLNQPWLQYNWRGVGDEDPSAVVTFGIFRGNDRVIYRGEARMNN
ncbi:hypothetical protein F9817_05900 [Vibrio sp. CAIM 722]|uniref:DUF6701 domain-containing protein n=1 Tax=Vibrio eleionomae TaxID=2653505 RepID=A0A7X4RU48_9VIBR|nr:DUF6701 domain-containing protein [Vibrio eleionomae]MZI92724.1 hypothetical protein [Vibrio eleionomae]